MAEWSGLRTAEEGRDELMDITGTPIEQAERFEAGLARRQRT